MSEEEGTLPTDPQAVSEEPQQHNASDADGTSWTSADYLLDAMKTFGPNHPLRIRIEGAQSTTFEQLVSATTQFQQFNADSDKLYSAFDDSLSAHVSLLTQIKKDLRALEDRVFAAKLRAVKIAEHDGVPVAAILDKEDDEEEKKALM